MQNKETSKAWKIGSTCVITYIASYYMRNLLGVLTPQMLETGNFTKEWLGLLSSSYMLFYAIGQLVNGVLGDRFSTKSMIVSGLLITGASSVGFAFSFGTVLPIICFGLLGYGLSMLRGPMMKMISENTREKHARVICAFFSSASFIGAFVAGLFAAIFKWKSAFIAAGAVIFMIAAAAYIVITGLERKNMIIRSSTGRGKLDILGVFKADKFLFYIIISMLVEITTTSINFWIPTYLTEYLGFDKNDANMIFTVKSILRAASPFIAIAIYERIRDEIKIIKYSFLVSAVFLIAMLFAKNVWINILFFFISLTVSGFAAAVLWSIYIPSLKATGKVSSANGVIDCSGYIGAATANMVFASMADGMGWDAVIILWSAIMAVGFMAAVFEQIKIRVSKRS